MSKVMEECAAQSLAELGLLTAARHLDTCAQQAAAENWSYTHFLGFLLDGELKERHRVRVEMSLQFARFPYLKRLADFDFKAQPSVDQRLIDELAISRFLCEGRNIIFLDRPVSEKLTWQSRLVFSQQNWATAFTLQRRLIWHEN